MIGRKMWVHPIFTKRRLQGEYHNLLQEIRLSDPESHFRWRLFRRPIVSQPDRVVTYTKAAVALHNYLRTTESSVYCPPGFTDGEDGERNVIEGAWWIDDEQSTRMGHVACTSSNRYVIISMKCTFILPPPLLYTRHSRSAASIRDSYRDYLQVPEVKCRGSTPMYGEQSELVPCGDKQYSIILFVIINFIIHNLNMFQNSYW